MELLDLRYKILGQVFVFALLLHFPNFSHGLPERLANLVARLLLFSLDLFGGEVAVFEDDYGGSVFFSVLSVAVWARRKRSLKKENT